MGRHHRMRSALVHALLAALVLAGLPASAGGAAPAVLAGSVIGTDGLPAAGCRVHLIDRDGRSAAVAETDARGGYVFEGVPPGRYGLGVADAAGRHAPVAGPPLALAPGQAARRDLELVSAGAPDAPAGTRSIDPSVGQWWSDLSGPAKTWVVVAVVVAGWFLYETLTRDDEETPASPV